MLSVKGKRYFSSDIKKYATKDTPACQEPTIDRHIGNYFGSQINRFSI